METSVGSASRVSRVLRRAFSNVNVLRLCIQESRRNLVFLTIFEKYLFQNYNLSIFYKIRSQSNLRILCQPHLQPDPGWLLKNCISQNLCKHFSAEDFFQRLLPQLSNSSDKMQVLSFYYLCVCLHFSLIAAKQVSLF